MATITLRRTTAEDEDFLQLVQLLDADLAHRDGADHGFYSQYNKTRYIRQVIVACDADGRAVACGALKEFEPGAMEVKRMYTLPAFRGRGIAQQVLQELESWAREMQYQRCILETGKRQPEAIRLYEKSGYRQIPNYGQYAGIDNSVCFEKRLAH